MRSFRREKRETATKQVRRNKLAKDAATIKLSGRGRAECASIYSGYYGKARQGAKQDQDLCKMEKKSGETGVFFFGCEGSEAGQAAGLGVWRHQTPRLRRAKQTILIGCADAWPPRHRAGIGRA